MLAARFSAEKKEEKTPAERLKRGNCSSTSSGCRKPLTLPTWRVSWDFWCCFLLAEEDDDDDDEDDDDDDAVAF